MRQRKVRDRVTPCSRMATYKSSWAAMRGWTVNSSCSLRPLAGYGQFLLTVHVRRQGYDQAVLGHDDGRFPISPAGEGTSYVGKGNVEPALVCLVVFGFKNAGIGILHDSKVPPVNVEVSQHRLQSSGSDLTVLNPCTTVSNVDCSMTALTTTRIIVKLQPVPPGVATRPAYELPPFTP